MEKNNYQKKQYRKKNKYTVKEEEKNYQPKHKFYKKEVVKSDEEGFKGTPEEWFNGMYSSINT